MSDEACQKSFEELKMYLLNPPVLITPVAGKWLIIYVVVREDSIKAVLEQTDASDTK